MDNLLVDLINKNKAKGEMFLKRRDKVSNKKINQIYETCYICHRTNVNSQYIQCDTCQSFFHSTCYYPLNSHQDKDTNIRLCSFCRMIKTNTCVICNKEIDKYNDLEVECEFCSSKMHYKCLDIPFNYFLLRYYYSKPFDTSRDDKNLYNKILKQLSQKEADILSKKNQRQAYIDCIQKETKGYQHLLTLFSVCNFCIKKPKYNLNTFIAKNENKRLVQVCFFPFNQNIHSLFVNTTIYESINELDYNIHINKEDIVSNSNIFAQSDLFKIKKIHCFNRIIETKCEKTILKWSNNVYSIENHSFMRTIPEYMNLINQYIPEHSDTPYKAPDMVIYRSEMIENDNCLTNVLLFAKNEDIYKSAFDSCIKNIFIQSYKRFQDDFYRSKQISPKYIIFIDRYQTMKKIYKERIHSKVKGVTIKTLNLKKRNSEDKLYLKLLRKDPRTGMFNIIPDILIISLECFKEPFMIQLLNLQVNAIVFLAEFQDSFKNITLFIKEMKIYQYDLPLLFIFYLSLLPIQSNNALLNFNKILFDRNDKRIISNSSFDPYSLYNCNLKFLPNTLDEYLFITQYKLHWYIDLEKNEIKFEHIKNDIRNYFSDEIQVNILPDKANKVIRFIPIDYPFPIDINEKYTLQSVEDINDISSNTFMENYENKLKAVNEILSLYDRNIVQYVLILYSATNNKKDNDYYNEKTNQFESSLSDSIARSSFNNAFSCINIDKDCDHYGTIMKYKERYGVIVIIQFNVFVHNPLYLNFLFSLSSDCYQLYNNNTIEHDLLYAYFSCLCIRKKRIDFGKIIIQMHIELMNQIRTWYPSRIDSDSVIRSDLRKDGIIVFGNDLFFYTVNGDYLFKKNKMKLTLNESIDESAQEIEFVSETTNKDSVKLTDFLKLNISQCKDKKEKISLIQNYFVENGLSPEVREYIVSFIACNSFNEEELNQKVNDLKKGIESEYHINIDITILRFYFEYILLVLYEDSIDEYISQFLFTNDNRNELVMSIMLKYKNKA